MSWEIPKEILGNLPEICHETNVFTVLGVRVRQGQDVNVKVKGGRVTWHAKFLCHDNYSGYVYLYHNDSIMIVHSQNIVYFTILYGRGEGG